LKIDASIELKTGELDFV